MKPTTVAPRVEVSCDFCLRAFARVRGQAAVCPSCGRENRRESAMLGGGQENAMLSNPKPRVRRSRKA